VCAALHHQPAGWGQGLLLLLLLLLLQRHRSIHKLKLLKPLSLAVCIFA
jgi:hypothetical protein